jgi:hypothetical protein
MLLLLIIGKEKIVVRVFISDVIFMPRFVEIGRLVQKLGRGDPQRK